MMMRKGLISAAVMGILLMAGSLSSAGGIAPLWSFKIDDMTDFALSRNGEHVIVACEKGPLCENGQYYVFDRYGETVKYGCIEGEITVVDIADNGAFFIGTRTGYYLSSDSGRIEQDLDMGSMFQSASISENGEAVIAGANKEMSLLL